MPLTAPATHYPDGSFCYDCHAISESKMVANTQLIKRSQKTIDLSVTGGAPIPCLFCHEPNASSALFNAARQRPDGGYKMAPAMNHFDASSQSKHPVALSSSLADPAGLDCVDCHTGIGIITFDDGLGNATIHGVDASAVSIDPYAGLITDTVQPTNAAEVSTLTCQASACHDGDGHSTDYTAPPAHPFASGVSLNDVAGTVQCFDPTGLVGCHDSHSSVDGESLVVLKNTSGANGQLPTGVTVAPDECEVCHVADDGAGPANDWMTRGHGGSTYESLPDKPAASIGLMCLSCHDENQPHDWTRTNQRFGLPVGTSTSSLTGKALRSVCTNCHMGMTPHQGQAGCLDCHDPHGQGVGTNILMIRQQIPVASPADTVVFEMSGKYDTALNFDYWRSGDTSGAGGSSRGMCDNTDCHGAVTNINGNPIFPLQTYFTTYATDHAGGTQTVGSNCEGCHKHNSTSGSWGVGADVCGACHGYPPSNSDPYADNPDAVGVHDLHASQLGYGCSECHFGNTHNTSGWSANTGSAVPSANVDVGFSPAANPNGTYTPASNTCANLTCHNPDDPVNGVPVAAGGLPGTARQATTTNSPQWLDSFAAVTGCTGCHGFTAPTDSHYKHDNPAGRSYACQVCHNGLDAVTNSYSAAHADGALTDPALVSFDLAQAGLTVAVPNPYDNLTSECSNVYCHGPSLAAGGTDVTPQWGVLATGACGNCHDTGLVDSSPGSAIGTGNHTDHLTGADGPVFGTEGCANCHPAYALDAAAHVNGSRDLANINTTTFATSPLGTLPVTVPTAADTDRCSHCHSTATVNGQVGTTLAKAGWATDATVLACLTCHNGTDPASNNPDGSGRPAPDMLGDDTTYGAELLGHNRTTGSYPVTSNPAANRSCTDCHLASAGHLNDADDTSYAGNRLLTTVNTVATGSTVTGLCGACHQSGAGTPALAQVATHGNTDPAFQGEPTHDPNAEDFVYNCQACHEPHGMTLNGRTATSANIAMIRSALAVEDYSTPGGGGGTATVGVVFEARTGTDSYDDGGATPADNMCVACHVNGNRPGAGSALTNAAGDGSHAGLNNISSDERGNDCSQCHRHNRDTDVSTVDAFMPVACSECHGGGLAGEGNGNYWPDSQSAGNGTAYPNRVGAHQQHIDRIAEVVYSTATPSTDQKNSTCDWCHPGGGHSGDQLALPADLVDGTSSHFKDIVGNLDSGESVIQSDNGTPGVQNDDRVTCSNVNCHYNTDPPATGWYVNLGLNCSSCHISGFTYTPGDLPDAHQAHLDEIADGGQYLSCTSCHVNNGSTNDGHQDGVVGIKSTPFPYEVDGDQNIVRGSDTGLKYGTGTAATQFTSCGNLYCHGDLPGGNAANVPNWFNTVAQVGAGAADGRCGTCHGDSGTGNPMPNVAESLPGYANKHGQHVTGNGYGCQTCHYAVTTDGSTIADTGLHLSGAVDVDDDNLGSTLDSFDYAAPPTCAAANCHGGNSVAWNYDVGTNGSFTCDICHGEVAGSPTNTDVNNFGWDGTTQSKVANVPGTGEYDVAGHGAQGLACAACHDSSSPHDTSAGLSGTNPFRLADQGGGAGVQFSCSYDNAACHQGTTAGGLDYQTIVNHSSADMTATGGSPNYTWTFAPDCVNCHDPHGDGANLSMIQRELYDKAAFTVTDGAGSPPAAPTEQTSLVFTDNTTGMSPTGTSYADSNAPFSAICQECHEGTPGTDTPRGFVDNASANFSGHPGYVSATGDNAGDCSDCHKHNSAFQPSGCDSCHGFPPVPAAFVGAGGNTSYVLENYAGGGGMHYQHVEFLQAQIGPSTDARELCGPCHGDGAGSTDHNGSSNGTGAWALSARAQVNIRSRASGNSWDGMAGDPLSSTYGGTAVTAGGAAVGVNAVVSSANSRCVGVDCHGNPSSSDTVEVLWWNVNLAANAPGTSNGTEESRTCEGCHDETPAEVRVFDTAGAGAYTGNAPDAATSYYGTLSGYSRGGHGDKTINSTDDPSFVDSGSGSTPLECLDCHDATVAHFPEPASGGNIHRLANPTLETTSHTGLCNTCHASADYPGGHHPSYEGVLGNSATDVIPAGGQEVMSAVDGATTWTEQPPGSSHYEQNDYGAANYTGNPDGFVNWWAASYGLGNQDPPPRPVFYGEAQSASPKAVLPLEQYVLGTGVSNRVMCVTCHNPHGTDLFTYDATDNNPAPGGANASIPDNNMLRLRDSDNTLCNACH